MGWVSKVAHLCGLQLMLAIDGELRWVVTLAHVYIWPLPVAWASHNLVIGSERSTQGQAYKRLVVLEAAKLLMT